MVRKSHPSWRYGVALLAILLAGCGKSLPPEKTYPAGSTVELGPLSYSIGATEWQSSLDGERGPRVPSGRFLIVTVSVTNKKSDESTMPLLSALDSSGQPYLELDSGEGLANWLGLFRNIPANGNEGGQIVFDVPPDKGPYKIRISSGGDIEKELTALVEVPDENAAPSTAPVPASAGQ
jgi:hypothetical protein